MDDKKEKKARGRPSMSTVCFLYNFYDLMDLTLMLLDPYAFFLNFTLWSILKSSTNGIL